MCAWINPSSHDDVLRNKNITAMKGTMDQQAQTYVLHERIYIQADDVSHKMIAIQYFGRDDGFSSCPWC